MKKLLVVLMTVLMSCSFVFADDTSLEELKQQITALQDEIDTISKRVGVTERHVATDKVSLGVELRTRVDSINYDDVRALPAYANDMMTLWLNGNLTSGAGNNDPWDTNGDLWNDAFMTNYQADFMNLYNDLMTDMDFQTGFGGLVGMDGMGNFENTEWLNGMIDYSGMTGMVADMNSNGVVDYADVIGTIQMAYSMDAESAQMTANMMAFAYLMNDGEITAAEASVMKSMFKGVKPRKYDTENSSMFTNKLRLRLSSKVNNNLSFTGRLVMYKGWGDSNNVKFFDGTFKSMYLDSNSGAVPTDDSLHVERAYFVYKNHMGPVDYHFSFGRRPSTYGPGYENHENSVLGGSPVSSIINMNFDGASLQFGFDEWVPGSFIKFCYGRGYEGQYGTANALSASNGLVSQSNVDDVDFFGVIFKFYDDEQYKFWYNYARGFGITDGFTGMVAMPFLISGKDYNMDGEYDEYSFNANYGGYTSRFEPTAEIGDVELHAFLAQGENFGFSWFASYNMSQTHPDGRSNNPMFQFMEQDKLLGSDSSKRGDMVWLGVMTPALPFTGGKLGFEYNHGSKNWFNFAFGEDDLVGSKLAVRGDVYEVYYHQPIVDNKFFATIGYQYFDYDYTGSGNPLAKPTDIDDVDGLSAMMPVVDKVSKFYGSFTYSF
jgi:hypothetical protein